MNKNIELSGMNDSVAIFSSADPLELVEVGYTW